MLPRPQLLSSSQSCFLLYPEVWSSHGSKMATASSQAYSLVHIQQEKKSDVVTPFSPKSPENSADWSSVGHVTPPPKKQLLWLGMQCIIWITSRLRVNHKGRKIVRFINNYLAGGVDAKDRGTSDSAWGGDDVGGREEVAGVLHQGGDVRWDQNMKTLSAKLRNLDLHTMGKEVGKANP